MGGSTSEEDAPLEWRAPSGTPSEARQPIWIGSVKSNIGSLDAAGGLAGLIKAVLALRHREIPPTLNRAQDPEGFDPNGPFRFADRAVPWSAPPDGGARIAGVHAYGLGGTNAHVVLEEHPDRRPAAAATTGPYRDGAVGAKRRCPAPHRGAVARLARRGR